ncbi:MAG: hypothetical protein HOV66_24985 [Streptomycetaceae bacterium]|nr:hypothetical protein [Streptomycetaceae bacterium]NUS58078.1 hypothetical protein [Streptomycetaceae bacterium]
MTPLERLLAEELPTGTFGHAQPPRAPRPDGWWTAQEQAQHVADLLAALADWQYREPDPEEPPLRLVRGKTDAA